VRSAQVGDAPSGFENPIAVTFLCHKRVRSFALEMFNVSLDNTASCRRSLYCALLVCLLLGCAGRGKSVEMLDEHTGVTMAALSRPLAFSETGIYDVLVPDKQAGMVYVGPFELDRTGDFSYVLWVQVLPGVGGHPLDDIRARGALNLEVDDGIATLSALDQVAVAASPYQPVASAGQTAYFAIDVALLKRMAASRTLKLNLRAGDLTMVDFVPLQNTQAALRQFMIDRHIND
jgi:hypothetical protein